MKSFLTQRVVYSVLFYSLLCAVVFLARPSFAFDKNTGNIRPFGVGVGAGVTKTPFSLSTMSSMIAIAVFAMFCAIDSSFS